MVIGTADFLALEGVVHAPLIPAPAYSYASDAAQRLGLEFSRTQFWSPLDGDFADEASARWGGGRLALEDQFGRELGVNNIVVIEFPGPRGHPPVRVVADFRPDLARVEAFLQTIGPSDCRRRPAA